MTTSNKRSIAMGHRYWNMRVGLVRMNSWSMLGGSACGWIVLA